MSQSEWVLVQRGRRPTNGQRQRQGRRDPTQDKSRWGTDRARAPQGAFVPGGYKNYVPNPQPAPPRGSFWRPDPSPRPSYAQVVQGFGPRFGLGTGRNRFQGGNNSEYIKPDKRFKLMIHKFHSLIKVVHHRHNVIDSEEDGQPKMIQNVVEALSNMVKPALPSQKTKDCIVGNARNWGYTTLLILQQHYEDQIVELLSEIEGFHRDEWEEPFKVAVKWSRKKLPRLKETTINQVKETVAGTVKERQSNRAEMVSFPNLNLRRPDPATTTHDLTVRFRDQGTDPPAPSPPQRQLVVRGVEEVRTPPGVIIPLGTPPHRSPEIQGLPPRPARVRRTRRVSLPEAQDLDDLLDIPKSGDMITPTPIGAATAVQDLVVVSEREGTIMEGAVVIHHRTPAQAADLIDFTVDLEEWEKLSIYDEEEEIQENPDQVEDESELTAEKGCQGQDEVRSVGVEGIDGNGEGSSGGDSELNPTPQPCDGEVTQHTQVFRKLMKWDLDLRKKKVIIGDSNLGIIQGFQDTDLQIDSYPGATFRHAEALLKKATVGVEVEQLVLSFGISHYTQTSATAIKQLRGAVGAAKQKCPNARILIPLINFDKSLSEESQEVLGDLNKHIEQNMSFIPRIPDAQFHTTDDGIHWTVATAEYILENMIRALN